MNDQPILDQMPAPAACYAVDEARLGVLDRFDAEALEDDPELQAIVNFAARLCDAPASMVSLVEHDRQYFLARTGIDARETPRELAFCTHALGQSEALVVPDASRDDRFAHNPLVTGDPAIRFYAGQPLVSEEGAPLGTLCVIDPRPRADALDDFQREGMKVLARAAMRRLEARRKALAAKRERSNAEDRFRALADSIPDISFSADENGHFDYFNRRWHEFTGFDQPWTDDVGRQVLHPDEHDAIVAEWRHSVTHRAPYERENRLRQADGKWRWVLVRAHPVEIGQSGRVRWFGTITDVDEAHKLSDNRDMLAKELAHRIKNIFAVISGLISLEARKTPEHAPFAATLNETLGALGRAHDFVRPAGGMRRDSLAGLLEVVFAPYVGPDAAPRVRVTGEDTAIAQAAATPLALVFHELATNSAKYGALSVDGGHVTLAIARQADRVVMQWREHGGPPARDSGKTGYGSRMVDLAVTGQLQGTWERRFDAGGLQVSVDLPLAAIAAPEDAFAA